MRISVLSGKGGTGKTFLAVNLAYVASPSVYIDCDVEEPNGNIFLKPKIWAVEKKTATFPKIDTAKCSGCKTCVTFCKFNALAFVKIGCLFSRSSVTAVAAVSCCVQRMH